MLAAVRTSDPLALGASHRCRCRAKNAPTSVPAVLKMMSLRAGSLPGMMICANSTAAATNRPQTPAIAIGREPHPMARPSGMKRHEFRMPSASPRRPNVSENEKGDGETVPDGLSVTTSMAKSTAPITNPCRSALPHMAIFIAANERYLDGTYDHRIRVGEDRESICPSGLGYKMERSRKQIFHHFTVDVEEYFQVLALEPYAPRSEWEKLPSRLDVGLHLLLDLLSEHEARATFFVLGWIAERAPALVREIAERGHEVASHGSDHRRVTTITRDQFRESVRSSKRLLEDVTGQPVFGYRAPNFSIVRGGEWALDILLQEKYRYDSSLFPVRRKEYGFVGGGRDPYRLELPSGTLEEIPPATLNVGRAIVPAAGGAYFRHLPYSLVSSALLSAERRGVPGTFYIHPWELDPGQPRITAPLLTRVRHYGGLARTIPRLKRLLSSFRFQPIAVSLHLMETLPSLK
jgi:polysaccharide deacetylase family protein (PEP-CTERM system associated)